MRVGMTDDYLVVNLVVMKVSEWVDLLVVATVDAKGRMLVVHSAAHSVAEMATLTVAQ